MVPSETTPAADPSESTPSGYVVRYGTTRNLGEFTVKGSAPLPRSTEVVVRSDRGIEWGEVLCPAGEKTREYLKVNKPVGKLLRTAGPDDRRELEQVRRREKDYFHKCGEIVTRQKLQMQLVDVELIFGGERLIFYYVAEKRVDFRELVKSLAREFKTRIELRQIGVRDEARLLADYGDCGKPVCCNTHLREMPPVSMKMAKVQKATLDPTKISGRCGRLKCCLRYEYDTYRDYQRELPKVGAMIITKTGQGKVIGQEILARKVLVQYENSRVMVDLADVVTVIQKSQKKPRESQ
jgi:cell fate regulator YaaT (PSP1 superfamily)